MEENTERGIHMNKNDDKILELRNKIAKEKEELGTYKSQSIKTNCVLNIMGTICNLNVLQEEDLRMLLVVLNSYKMSIKDLNDVQFQTLKFSGYDIEDWISDVTEKLKANYYKVRKQELNKLETKLNTLLSEDKRIELELSEIENLI